MKFLLFLVLIGVAVWMLTARIRRPRVPPTSQKKGPAEPTPMLACAHCGIHLPQAEALTDGAGRPYCTEAHRRAGPR
ncbi:MAG: PP0621 family protein [Rubrivivax sp.]|nr:PP0621 family protein [Rubrivivax sp.]